MRSSDHPFRPLYNERTETKARVESGTVEAWRLRVANDEIERLTKDRDGWRVQVEQLEATIRDRDVEIAHLRAALQELNA